MATPSPYFTDKRQEFLVSPHVLDKPFTFSLRVDGRCDTAHVRHLLLVLFMLDALLLAWYLIAYSIGLLFFLYKFF